MKVSIITVVFNGEKYLEQTIQSVLNQSYSDIEYIIIDGGSTDGTLDIIKKYEDKLGYWVSEKDNGIYDAMNKGISKATGELVGIINADDYYSPDAVTLVVDFYEKEDNPDILYANMELMTEDTNKSQVIIPSMKGLTKEMSLNHPTCFVKKILYDERKFNLNYSISADYELMMYFIHQNKSFYYIPQTLAYMRLGGASDNFVLSSKEVFLVQLKYFNIAIALKSITMRYLKRVIRIISTPFLTDNLIVKIKGFR